MRGQLPPPRVSCPPLAGRFGIPDTLPTLGTGRGVSFFSRAVITSSGVGQPAGPRPSRRSSCNSRRSAAASEPGPCGPGRTDERTNSGDPATGATGRSWEKLVAGMLGLRYNGRTASRARRPGVRGRSGRCGAVSWRHYPTGRVSCVVLPPRLQRPGLRGRRPLGAATLPPARPWAAPVPYRPGRSPSSKRTHTTLWSRVTVLPELNRSAPRGAELSHTVL